MKDHRRKFLKIPNHSLQVSRTQKVFIFYLVVFFFVFANNSTILRNHNSLKEKLIIFTSVKGNLILTYFCKSENNLLGVTLKYYFFFCSSEILLCFAGASTSHKQN